jgi:hypothetical protein
MPVMRDGQHVRLFLAGGHRANDFARAGINHGDGLVQLGSDVKKTGGSVEDRLMRTHAMTKIDVADDGPRRDIDHEHFVAVDAGLAHAAAAVDRHKGRAPVGGDGNFVSVNAGRFFRDSGDFFCGNRIDETQIDIGLVYDQQRLRLEARGGKCQAESSKR